MDDTPRPQKPSLPPVSRLEPHPLAELIPEASPEEFKTLKQSIKTNGIREPIWLFENKILDGRHRVRAGLEVYYEFKPTDFRAFEGTYEQAKAFVEDVNLARRQLWHYRLQSAC
jgi:ParB family chromosome partitioning protein